MKKLVFFLVLTSLILYVLGNCNNGELRLNSTTLIKIHVTYNSISQTAYCSVNVGLPYDTANPDPATYQQCIVTFNGKIVPFDTMMTYSAYFSYQGGIILNTGGNVTVSIEHPDMDPVTANGKIPPSVTNVWVTGDVPGYLNGNPSTVTLSWDAVTCNEYLAEIMLYDTTGSIFGGYNYPVTASTTWQFDQNDLYNANNVKASSISFSVMSINSYSIAGLASNSTIKIGA